MSHKSAKIPMVRAWTAATRSLRPSYSGKDLYLLHLVHRYLYDINWIGKRFMELSDADQDRYFEIKRIAKAKLDEIWPEFLEEGK